MASDYSARFWLSRAGTTEGPFDIAALSRLIEEGRVRARDKVTLDGSKWFSAGLLKVFPQTTVRYHDWLWCLQYNTANMGTKGPALMLAAVPITLVATILGLALFPPGLYPRIVLAAPGFIVGAIFVYLFGFVVFKLPTVLSVLLCVVAAIPAAVVAFRLYRVIFA